MKKSIGSGRGSVYNILLKALQTGDKYGYEICKEIEEKTAGSYILKQASLYSGLKRLEAQGDITSYWQDSVLGGRRHYYSLTEKGKERIIRSNFSWTDARDDIVDNLFEKSQLDKEIEQMQNDLNQIQDNQVLSESNQRNIDYILENTANLGTEKTEENKEEAEDKNLEDLYEAKEKLDEESSLNEEENKEIFEDKTESQNNDADYSFDGDDLFSMFNTNHENNDEKPKENVEETIDNLDNEDKIEEVQNNSFENIEDEDKQLDLFSIASESNIESSDDEEKQEETESEENVQTESFDEIIQNMQTVENQDDNPLEDSLESDKERDKLNDEYLHSEIYEEYSSQKDEQLSLYENKEQTLDDEYVDKVAETYNLDDNSVENENDKTDSKENQENDDEIFSDKELANLFEQNDTDEQNQTNEENLDNQNYDYEEKVSTLQKSNVNILEEYRKNHVSFNKFSDSTQFEEPENTFSNFFGNESLFNDSENEKQQDITPKQEDHFEEEKPKEENVLYYDLANNKEEVKTQKQTSTLDYKDIFGDLVSSKEAENQDNEELIANDKTDEEISETNNENVEQRDEVKPQEKQNTFDDLPRIDSDLQDINRTFMQSKEPKENNYSSSSSNFERYDSSPFEASDKNPFEKYDTYEPMIYNNNSNAVYHDEVHEQKTNDLAFDKKYANIYNKFEVPDYEVRYFKKSTPTKNNQSKFISINRLNLAVSCILCLLMCIATTITLIASSKNAVNSFQTTCYILSYIILALIISFDFTKYMLNKNKKVNTLNKNESLINLFFAIFVAILSISINLFLGMSFANIINYMGSFTLPLYYSLYLLVKFPLKKFLSKFANFYN